VKVRFCCLLEGLNKLAGITEKIRSGEDIWCSSIYQIWWNRIFWSLD